MPQVRTWPLKPPPPSLQPPLSSRALTPTTPTTCSLTPSSFSILPKIIAANTAIPSRMLRVTMRTYAQISISFAYIYINLSLSQLNSHTSICPVVRNRFTSVLSIQNQSRWQKSSVDRAYPQYQHRSISHNLHTSTICNIRPSHSLLQISVKSIMYSTITPHSILYWGEPPHNTVRCQNVLHRIQLHSI